VWSDIIAKYGDLSELKEVYFAGGEVFFQQEHWQMLEHLKQLGMRDIRLTYVTNLTRLSMGTYRIQDYLAYFTNVLFIVSMDGIDSVFEYIRSGGDWKRFVTNLEVIKQYPVSIRFNIVVTIYNILSLNQVFDFIDSNGFDKYDLSIANYPEDQNIVNLPQELKILATQRLTKYPRAQSVINYMNQPAIVAWDKVVSQTTQLDQTRKESILKIIPEFTPYWK
jgi:sulfatase maturation enzyme AslB (radical SAM superfamily)